MPYSDSIFLFESAVEDLRSTCTSKHFHIKCEFADYFVLTHRYPNVERISELKDKFENNKINNKQAEKYPSLNKVGNRQSIVIATTIKTLMNSMTKFPIEITLSTRDDTINRLGLQRIPWNPTVIDYVSKIGTKSYVTPIEVRERLNFCDVFTSQHVASVTICSKLTHLKNRITSSKVVLTGTPNHVHNSSKSKVLDRSKKNKCVTEKPRLTKTGDLSDIIEKQFVRKSKNTRKAIDREYHTYDIIKEENCEQNKVTLKEFDLSTATAGLWNEDDIGDKTKIVELSNGISNLHTSKSLLLTERLLNNKSIRNSRNSVSKSCSNIIMNFSEEFSKSKSCTHINNRDFNFLSYVFRDRNSARAIKNNVICVGYFTVEDHKTNGSLSDKTYSKKSSKNSEHSDGDSSCDCPAGVSKGGFTFKICEEECPKRKHDGKCEDIVCLKTTNQDTDAMLTLKKCDQIRCDDREMRKLLHPPPDTVHMDISSFHKECCVDDITGGVKTVAKMKYDEKDKTCYCECECTFGFVKKTTYCGICGGYEKIGEDTPRKDHIAPFPCPVYHKLVDINKQKSTSGSDRSRLGSSRSSIKKSSKSSIKKSSKPQVTPGSTLTRAFEKESDREGKKKKNNDDRFKFNYGYTAPLIGHSNCGMPCSGTLKPVPKNMGWLWTAENVPGMKYRPAWKPGCVHKHVLRLLRMAKDPGVNLSKKRRKDTGKKKRPLKRPLLTVSKKDGEYTVTMETMKPYSKPRTLSQQPFEDKPVITFKIGRTEEENRERQKRKDRAYRRLQRDQRDFIQSTFADMCKEICLKTYQQALGLLPNAEDPDCFCYPCLPGLENTNLDRSCSCSEDDVSFGTDSDSDEWLVEFTPPIAHFDPNYKGKKINKQDTGTQYTYLDYRVKLLDSFGNDVPRFFKGPDGKTQCSDLGGFWGPDGKWLEINLDGFIAPDGRWAPLSFIGPQGDHIECETGKFQDSDGTWLEVGVDGYVDSTGKWRYYGKHKILPPKRKQSNIKKGTGDKKCVIVSTACKASDTTWSCFGDAKPKQLSRLGILGHGHDKRLLLQTLREMINRGEHVKIPEPSMIPRAPTSRRGRRKLESSTLDSFYSDKRKCKHPVPSDKGIVAVDDFGNKTYFRLKGYTSKNPNERMDHLTSQGISLSSFHVPCLSSFINAEILKKQQYERFLRNKTIQNDLEYGVTRNTSNKNATTQYRYRYAI